MKKPKSGKLFGRKFRNWLLGLVLSRQDLKSILSYTLNALKQDGAEWQAKIALLQPRYDAFDARLVARAGAGAQQQGQTLQADTVYRLIKTFMKRAYKKSFAALEEDNKTLYEEFFPQGRTEFTGGSRQTIGTAFPRFVQTLTAHQAAVPNGAALLTDATTLAAQWKAARTAQDERKKTVKTVATTLDADETDILIELFGVYAALLAKYYKTPERVLDYFDFSVLPTSQPEADDADAEPVTPPTPPTP